MPFKKDNPGCDCCGVDCPVPRIHAVDDIVAPTKTRYPLTATVTFSGFNRLAGGDPPGFFPVPEPPDCGCCSAFEQIVYVCKLNFSTSSSQGGIHWSSRMPTQQMPPLYAVGTLNPPTLPVADAAPLVTSRNLFDGVEREWNCQNYSPEPVCIVRFTSSSIELRAHVGVPTYFTGAKTHSRATWRSSCYPGPNFPVVAKIPDTLELPHPGSNPPQPPFGDPFGSYLCADTTTDGRYYGYCAVHDGTAHVIFSDWVENPLAGTDIETFGFVFV